MPDSGSGAGARPFGRALADFGELLPAETILQRHTRRGEMAIVGDARPKSATHCNSVRAAFVRFLALGGDDGVAVHERGVQLKGAWLIGPLDLEAVVVPYELMFNCCVLEDIVMRDATCRALSFDGSRLGQGVCGDRVRCTSFRLVDATVERECRLLDAVIDGTVECNGAELSTATGDTLNLTGAKIGGDVVLSIHGESLKVFTSVGCVNLQGATVGGTLDASGGQFDAGPAVSAAQDEQPTQKIALCLDLATVHRGIRISEGFRADGQVSIINASVFRYINCFNSTFITRDFHALTLERTLLDGALIFTKIKQIKGCCDFSFLRVTLLADDHESWKFDEASFIFDGFTYQRIVDDLAIDAKQRAAWLGRQVPDDSYVQPWEQLIAVLRAMGYPEQARRVAMIRQDRWRRAGRIGWTAWVFHWLYGLLVGYGYRPMRLLMLMAVVWLGCAAIFAAAVTPGHWLRADSTTARWIDRADPPAAICADGLAAAATGSRECQVAATDYSGFEPLFYSLDVLLPVIDIGQQDDWAPVIRADQPQGRYLRWLIWFEIAFGWLSSLLLVGVLGNLIKKD